MKYLTLNNFLAKSKAMWQAAYSIDINWTIKCQNSINDYNVSKSLVSLKYHLEIPSVENCIYSKDRNRDFTAFDLLVPLAYYFIIALNNRPMHICIPANLHTDNKS